MSFKYLKPRVSYTETDWRSRLYLSKHLTLLLRGGCSLPITREPEGGWCHGVTGGREHKRWVSTRYNCPRFCFKNSYFSVINRCFMRQIHQKRLEKASFSAVFWRKMAAVTLILPSLPSHPHPYPHTQIAYYQWITESVRV